MREQQSNSPEHLPLWLKRLKILLPFWTDGKVNTVPLSDQLLMRRKPDYFPVRIKEVMLK